MNREAAIGRLPTGYRTVFDRVTDVCRDDDRVRAVWLGGSIARGDADLSSDLDVLIAVTDDCFEAFVREWESWLATITDTVIARALPFAPGSFYSVTPTMERLDVVTERVSALSNTFHRTRLLVFDKDGCDALIPAPWVVPGPSAAAVAGIVEEFFRDYAMFHVVTTREDWLLGLEAIGVIRGLLYKLFVETNAPLPTMGVKRWSEKLTEPQRAVLESLPAARARGDEVTRVHEHVSLVFVREARHICTTLHVRWPEDLQQLVCASLRHRGLSHLAS